MKDCVDQEKLKLRNNFWNPIAGYKSLPDLF